MKGAKIAESNSTTCEWIFHQLAVKNLNVSAEQRSTASVIQYSVFRRGLSGLKNIWPVIMTGIPLSIILSPGWLSSGCLPHKSNQLEPFSVSPKIFVQVNLRRSPYLGQEGPNTNVQRQTGFANFIDEWSQFDFCFTNFGVILEYLESSITTKKAIFRLSSKVSWHVYTIVRDTRSSCGGPLTWKAQIHGSIHRANFDSNLPPSCFVMQYIQFFNFDHKSHNRTAVLLWLLWWFNYKVYNVYN